MADKLRLGTYVRTVKPRTESKDWTPDARATRKWNVEGKIVGVSNRHGSIYEVQHQDRTSAWYEPQELCVYPLGERGISLFQDLRLYWNALEPQDRYLGYRKTYYDGPIYCLAFWWMHFYAMHH